MSRKEIIGEKFTIVFGVDRVTGAFVQLWVNPAEEQDKAIIVIDNNGVSMDRQAEQTLTADILLYLTNTLQRFRRFWDANPGQRPNLGEQDVIALARVVGGFPDIAADVYRIFGDDL